MIRAAVLSLGLAAALVVAPLQAQPRENAVKAAFIPKFARYVEWPAAMRPGPREPYQVCVIGHDGFGPLLDRSAETEQIDGHGVAVRRLAGPQDSGTCHVAFVRGANAQETARFLSAMRSQPTLTVTDAAAGPVRGMVHFTRAAGRVRFLVDEASAAESGLTISSRLLVLALAVRQRRPS